MEERAISWKQILFTALVTGVVTIVAGLILFRLQTKKPQEPRLVYEVPYTRPFRGTDLNFAIYNVPILNPGTAYAPDVVGVIQVPSATLEELHITSAPSITYTHKIARDTLELHIPELNPDETILVSLLATSEADLPNSPDVWIRGTGVTGVERTAYEVENERKPMTSQITAILSGLLASFSVVGSFFATSKILRKLRGEEARHPTMGEQNKILVYLCSIHGLKEDADEYLSRPEGIISFWSEADRFAALALGDPTTEEAEKRKRILVQLIGYASMATRSVGITHYNIARIAFAQGKDDEAKYHLREAKRNAGKLIDTRLKFEHHLQELVD